MKLEECEKVVIYTDGLFRQSGPVMARLLYGKHRKEFLKEKKQPQPAYGALAAVAALEELRTRRLNCIVTVLI